MKVLFFHVPSLGMYHAIEPILLELRARGHQVIHYNEAGFSRYARNVTVGFAPYDSYQGYFPNTFNSSMNLYELGLLLLETAEHMTDFVEAAILRESPDLILHSKFMAGFRKRAKKFYDRYPTGAADADDIFVNDEALNLVLSFEMFQPARESLPSHCRFVGPTVRVEGYSKSYESIYVSLGSVFVDNRAFFDTCIQALGPLGRRTVISLSGCFSPEDFNNVPGNIELCRFVRQTDVLQHAAVFITHGGDQSVSEAIYCETPMVVVPQIPEQLLRAQQVQRMVVGKYIDPGELTVDLLRSTVAEVLENGEFRQNVRAWKASLPDVPSAVTACDQIEEVALRIGKRLVTE